METTAYDNYEEVQTPANTQVSLADLNMENAATAELFAQFQGIIADGQQRGSSYREVFTQMNAAYNAVDAEYKEVEDMADTFLETPTFESCKQGAINSLSVVETGLSLLPMNGDADISKAEQVKFPGAALTLIAAYTGGGKTTTMRAFTAYQILMQKECIYYSLEEDSSRIYAGVMSAYLKEKGVDIGYHHILQYMAEGIEPFKVSNGGWYRNVEKLESQLMEAQQECMKYLQIVNGLKLGNEEARRASVFKAICASLKKKGRNPIIFADYAQLFTADSEYSAPYLMMKETCQTLKEITAGMGFTVVAGVQLNREAVKAGFWGVQAEQLREAGDLEQAAAMVLFGMGDSETGLLNMRVLKNRNGSKDLAGALNVSWKHSFIEFGGNVYKPTIAKEEKRTPEKKGDAPHRSNKAVTPKF